METKQIDPQAEQKAQQEEYGRRIDYYLKKKNLGHVKENLNTALAKLELQMEKDGVSWQDLQQQRATEEVLELAQQATKYQFIADAVLRRALNESAKNKEFEAFDKEYSSHRAIEQRTEETTKAYEEAKEKYKANPSKENAARMIKNSGVIEDANLEGLTQSDVEGMRGTEDAMREKVLAERAEREKAETETYEKMLKNKHDPQGQRIAEMQLKDILRRKENVEDLAEKEAEFERKMAEERNQ